MVEGASSKLPGGLPPPPALCAELAAETEPAALLEVADFFWAWVFGV